MTPAQFRPEVTLIPIFKRKDDGMNSGVMIKERSPDEQPVDDSEYDGLESAMEELDKHLNRRDYKAAAECFRDAMELCKDSPESEESSSPHSYDAQNQKAAE